jgi:integrase
MAWIEKVWTKGNERRTTGVTQKAEKRDSELKAQGFAVTAYRVGNREPDGRKVYMKVRTSDEATRLKREIETALEKDSYITKSARARTLGEYFAARMADDTDLRDSTRYNKTKNFEKHVAPKLGDVPISSIKAEHVRKVLAEIDGPSARAYVRKILNTVFKQAVEDGLRPNSPMGGVKSSSEEPEKRRLVTLDELHAIVSATDERYQLPIMVAAACGLRAGEIGGLRVGDVDFEAHTISINQQITRGQGAAQIGPPKTKSSRRTIPVNEITDAISTYMQKYPPALDGRIFTTNGHLGMLSSSALGRTYRQGWQRAGIEPDYEGRVPELHGLRHFCASLMIKRGMNVKQLQRFLGHATAAETLDTYADLWPEDLGECAAISSEVMSGYRGLGTRELPALTG